MRGIRQHGLGRSLYEECTDGMDALMAAGFSGSAGKLLAFFPHASRNPYQRMLYARGFDHGFACFPLKAIDDVEDLPADMQLVLHYHWLHRVFDTSGNKNTAKKAADHFLEKLKRQKDAGHSIVWTAHNILSHAALFPEEEQALRAGMAKIADVIHVMNPETRGLCQQYYSIDEAKTISVPHPSYQGVYGDYMCARQARFNLNLNPDDKVFLLFGSLGPHKGTRQFLAAFDRLQARLEGKGRVLIAGIPGKPAFMEEILALTSGRADMRLFQTHVDDQAVQTFFKAADVVVCPYPIGLNSGVMATAATFGKPSVVPDMMARSLPGAENCVLPFEPGNMDSCHQACLSGLALANDAGVVTRLNDWALANSPTRLSDRFFSALSARLRGTA
ncbi:MULTISPECIES: glycosyltransferase [Kordiimonas]|jgi:glycosyltransferase involved in cell wall biosynthesis|uniref:glycosyltransferase n=1 Tax=Kordiimonas TaxID=288021 RepID=UPI00257F2F34|nr:glycosyltransferase [Kordiimonas sp. UBA4487]